MNEFLISSCLHFVSKQLLPLGVARPVPWMMTYIPASGPSRSSCPAVLDFIWTPRSLLVSRHLYSSGPVRWGLCNIGNPFETHLKKLKSREIAFAHNLFISYPIFLKFCTEYGSITAVLHATFQSDWINRNGYYGRTRSCEIWVEDD